jgi:hypothetical protein
VTKFARSIRRWSHMGCVMAATQNTSSGLHRFNLQVYSDRLLVQGAGCSESRARCLNNAGVCAACFAAANDKALTRGAGRMALLLDMVDVLEVVLHDPPRQSTFSAHVRSLPTTVMTTASVWSSRAS